MKNFCLTALLAIFLPLLCATEASGQIAYNESTATRLSIDTDFFAMRDNGLPLFRHSYDDYIQYTPAVVVLGMKAFGVDGYTGFGRFMVSSAFSTVIMAGVVNGLKYTVKRERPDGSAFNSFPSGHTATTFMTATLLHKEYGWKYPWISICGYSLATFVGASRILNKKHWMSDVITGAAVGIGSVHLGYYLTGLIFKDKYIKEDWHVDRFEYDIHHKYWGGDLKCGRRLILGKKEDIANSVLPFRGSVASGEFEFPLIPMTGVLLNVGCSSLTFRDNSSMNVYDALAGIYWSYPVARILELQAKTAIGYAWHNRGNGIDFQATVSLNLITGNNYKIKAFAEFETFSFSEQKPFLSSFVLGWTTGFFW